MDSNSDPLNPTTTEIPTDPEPRGPLTDAELLASHPDVAILVARLDVIAEEAPYLADPRQGVKRIAVALAAYFRTPDAP